MDWKIPLIVLAILAALFLVKRLSFVSAAAARQHLQQGALVVDVRTAEEFGAGHVEGAVNIPLDELQEALPRRVPDKQQVLLLHCLSGGRSGIAQRRLKALGYANVYNLGSLGRARKLIGSRVSAGQ
jgi:phage shock protein E